MTQGAIVEKISLKVSKFEGTFYLAWRQRVLNPLLLRDNTDNPPERLLQSVWSQQCLRRGALRTVDGRPVTVLHPGFWNREGGPDFSRAVLQFGEDPPVDGDVEVDLKPANWRAHGHHENEAFRTVVLQVVWDTVGHEQSPVPVVSLKHCLDAALSELSEWLSGDKLLPLPKSQCGQCHAPLSELSSDAIRELLRQAAMIRLEMKGRRLRALARQAGWNRALVEGMGRALGYKHNPWPMQRLAEMEGELRDCLNGETDLNSPVHWQAVLLGLSGLLPNRAESQSSGGRYLRSVWDIWWRHRHALNDWQLPRKTWRLNGLRPANHPHRRIALLGHWLSDERLVLEVQSWFAGLKNLPGSSKRGVSIASEMRRLSRILGGEQDAFWSRHWTLKSAPMTRQPLIGPTRVTDLVVNCLLPWFWIRAREGENEKLAARAQDYYFHWPKAEDNSVLRLARQRLLGGRSARFLTTAAEQQGLLQIVCDFCDHSNAICDQCRFPDLVQDWKGSSGGQYSVGQ